MADIKDVSTVIASALSEVGLSGTVDVAMDGGERVEALGVKAADGVEVVVSVRRLDETGHEPVHDAA